MSKAAWSLILFLFLLPTTVSAHDDFLPFQNRLLLHTPSKEYRLRAVSKPWQLLNTQEWQIDRQLVFGNEVFFITTANNQKSLFRSHSGVDFLPIVPIQNLDSLTFEVVDNSLFIEGISAGKTKLWQYQEGIITDMSSTTTTPGILERLIVVDKKVYVFIQNNNDLLGYEWQHGWSQVVRQPCQNSTVLRQPLPLIVCVDRVWQVMNNGLLTELLTDQSEILTKNSDMMFLRSLQDNQRYFVITSSIVTTLTVTAATITDAQAFGQRVFIKANGLLSELDWQSGIPSLLALPASDGSFVEASDGMMFLTTLPDCWSSTGIGKWQSVGVVGPLTNALKVTNGWILYQRDGANIQFSSDGKSFVLRNGAWSGSSKIKDVIEFADKTYVYLLNSSQNPNLYQTSDVVSWSRITLPTKPTFQLPIIQARALPAGTLVELEGVVTVLKNEVGAEITYLSDSTGGIQLFLSSEKGVINVSRFDSAVATGGISSSQTKRVTLSEEDDFSKTGTMIPLAALSASNILSAQQLGSRFRLAGLVSTLNADDFLLTDSTASLKIHLPFAKSFVKNGASVSLVALLDWSASTSKNEGWYTNEDLTIVSLDPTTPPSVTQQPAVQVKASTASVKKSAVAIAKNEIPIAQQQATAPTLVSASTEKVADSSQLPLPIIILLLSSALLLAVRGRRVRKYLIGL